MKTSLRRPTALRLVAHGLTALGLILSTPGFAQPDYRDPGDRRDRDWDRDHDHDHDHDRGRDERREHEREREMRWHRGDRLPPEFRGGRYEVVEWRRFGLRPPPPGYRWLQLEDAYVLAGDGWTVVDVVPIGYAPPPPPPPDDRDIAWRQRYQRTYTPDDDPTYSECHDKVDPAGVIAGALIGGLLGNAAGGRHDGGGATVVGVIAGGAVGAALTKHMDCGDRSYAYKTETDGFNAGRPGAYYEWRNPGNDHHGRFHVVDYYRDEDGFRCSVYDHEVFINGQREYAHGRACQQPNGAWAIID